MWVLGRQKRPRSAPKIRASASHVTPSPKLSPCPVAMGFPVPVLAPCPRSLHTGRGCAQHMELALPMVSLRSLGVPPWSCSPEAPRSHCPAPKAAFAGPARAKLPKAAAARAPSAKPGHSPQETPHCCWPHGRVPGGPPGTSRRLHIPSSAHTAPGCHPAPAVTGKNGVKKGNNGPAGEGWTVFLPWLPLLGRAQLLSLLLQPLGAAWQPSCASSRGGDTGLPPRALGQWWLMVQNHGK